MTTHPPAVPWRHRPALDGVRSIAVYAVLLFHAGIGAVDGGFVGVDLFFVLSGFLVSSILLNELDLTGRVLLWRFYARRVRRLLPAALVVVVATACLFVLSTSSVRRAPMVGDAQASLLYAANWRFLAESNDYFGADVDRSPYLHFWSLAIEEQFYVVFPILLLSLFVLSRRRRWALPVGVAGLFLTSVGAQLGWAARDANHAYFGTDARAYQLLAGVLAALALRATTSRRTSLPRVAGHGLAPAGLAVLVLLSSDLTTELSASLRGLVATAASVALVLGLAWADRQPLAWLLGRPLPAYLGRISYGTYLWHWPITLVLLELFDTAPVVIAAMTAFVATALAALSFEVIELPIRRAPTLAPWAHQTVAFGLAASVTVALVVAPPVLGSDRRPAIALPAGATSDGTGSPVPSDIDWSAYIEDKGPHDTFCTPDDLTSCVVESGDDGPHVTLIGDSNARSLAPALQKLAREHGFTLSLQILNGCPWQHRTARLADTIKWKGQQCRAVRDDMFGSVLQDLDVDVAVLLQLPRDRGKHLDYSGLTERELDEFNYAAQESTLDELSRIGVRAIVVEPIVRVPFDLPEPLECLAVATSTAECRVPITLEPTPSAAFARQLAASRDDAALVSLNDLMCPDAPLCEPLMGRVPVWRDREHYAPSALELVTDGLWERLTADPDVWHE